MEKKFHLQFNLEQLGDVILALKAAEGRSVNQTTANRYVQIIAMIYDQRKEADREYSSSIYRGNTPIDTTLPPRGIYNQNG